MHASGQILPSFLFSNERLFNLFAYFRHLWFLFVAFPGTIKRKLVSSQIRWMKCIERECVVSCQFILDRWKFRKFVFCLVVVLLVFYFGVLLGFFNCRAAICPQCTHIHMLYGRQVEWRLYWKDSISINAYLESGGGRGSGPSFLDICFCISQCSLLTL